MASKEEPGAAPASADLYLNSKKDFKPTKTEDWGYFFYPERFGSVYKPSWFERLFSFTGTTDTVNRVTCEKNVQNAIETRNLLNSTNQLILEKFQQYFFQDPGVKLLLAAMKNVGW